MIVCFTVSYSRGGAVGTTELFSGQCNHAININRVLQAVLALLAIGISVSFDFFMRLASSPNVDDLREAHNQGRSLDIAIHSFRNVRHISHWRRLGWITLILLAIPIQLFSHSIAFVSFGVSGYSRLLVSEAFTTGQPFAYPGVALLRSNLTEGIRSQFDAILPMFESASADWNKLEAFECWRIYSTDIKELQSHRNLLVVIETGPDADEKGWTAAQVWLDSPGHDDDFFNESSSELENSLWSFAVYCEVRREGYYDNAGYTQCSVSKNMSETSDLYAAESWGGMPNSIFRRSTPVGSSFMMRGAFEDPQVKYCLSEPYSAPCKVYVSNFFLLVTISCILFGSTCSTLIARFCWHKETCQSLGDALQAFLKSRGTFLQTPGAFAGGCISEGPSPPSTRWTPVSKRGSPGPRLGHAISKKIWLWTYVPIGMLLLGSSATLGALGHDISQVPNPLFCEQPKLRLTCLKVRLYPRREPQ